ncbi:glycosyltransferase [Neisseria lisongii]|uniref:Glycosyltransferase n=1 Tax=Neisseria lisongii TaxID=2912188 RepID=A0AAW5AFU9_9NEIS|nr:glycosyltransferase [Neisseria lisongii]MCF7530204.1 glycosyltransferase [Neisseria lisongii]
MHIVVIPSWYPKSEHDVDGIFFRNQAQALQRAGCTVGVIAPMFRYLRSEPASMFAGPYGLRRHRQGGLNTYAYDSMYFFPRCPIVDIDRIRWVNAGLAAFERYIADNGRPDAVHAHAMNYGGILAHAIYRRYGIPYVITEHSSIFARNLVRRNQWPSMHAAAQNCSARFAVSRDLCALLQQKYGLDWQYLPNILGSNFAEAFTFPNKTQQPFTFCSVAHLRQLKGFDILLPAFAQALQQRPNMRLNIGGDGPEAAKLRQMAADLGIARAVSFAGRLKTDEVLSLMRQSHAFVLASRTETFGVVFIEALSQGLPLIATRCGGPESIVNPNNGLLVPTDNPAALAQALIDMHDNPNRYSPDTLRQNCLAEFGESAVTGRLKNAFSRLIANNKP